MSSTPIALTIAGSDSGGGAGIQADLKSFSANKVYGASVITALTAQNTLGVTGIQGVPAEFISQQLDAVFSDLKIEAVKIGMLSQTPVIEAVATALKKYTARNIVLDPVMVATSGDRLIADDAVEALKSRLIPLADLITPNLHEASILAASDFALSDEDMIHQADVLLNDGARAVLLKGGHGEGDVSSDLLKMAAESHWFHAPHINTKNTHGTGCSLSSAIAANLALGYPLTEAVGKAKEWLTAAIAASDQLEIGQGSGPVHHFHELWSN